MTKLIAKRIATGLDRPLFATSPPGDTGRLFIVEQKTGLIKILRLATGTIDATPFLHVSGLNIGGNERGNIRRQLVPGGNDESLEGRRRITRRGITYGTRAKPPEDD
jgi:hypothetical protein